MRVQPLNTDFLQNIMGLGKPKRAQGVPVKPLPTRQPEPQGKLGELEAERNRPGSGVQEAAASGDIGAILDRLAPEQSAATHRHAGNATWSALGDAMGQMGSFLATSQGAPYQSPSMRHRDHLSMYEQKLAEYEQQSRAHELMVAQREITEITNRQQQEFEWQQQQLKNHNARQMKEAEWGQQEATATTAHERRLEASRQSDQARSDLQKQRDEEAAKRARTNQSHSEEKTETGGRNLYGADGSLVAEVPKDRIDQVTTMLLSEIGQLYDPDTWPPVDHGLSKRTEHLLGKTSLTDAEKWELVLDNWEKSSRVRQFLGLGEVPREEQRQGVLQNTPKNRRRIQEEIFERQQKEQPAENSDPLDLGL